MQKVRGFEVVKDEFRKHNCEIKLPLRATKTSAGYDFNSPEAVDIQPKSKHVIWTDVKAYMQEGEVLVLDVRSSIGIKKGLILANVLGIVDQDYFSNPKNDGNIGICLLNMTDEVVHIDQYERVAQGIFLPFLVSDNGNTDEERTGGIGSTNK